MASLLDPMPFEEKMGTPLRVSQPANAGPAAHVRAPAAPPGPAAAPPGPSQGPQQPQPQPSGGGGFPGLSMPSGGIEGLMTDPMFSIGLGLLSNSMSNRHGNLGDAVLGGVNSGMKMQGAAIENRAKRQAMVEHREQKQARARLREVMSGDEPVSQGEYMGLLAQAYPEQYGQGLLQQTFRQPQKPNSLVEQAMFAFPDDVDAQREFVRQNAGGDAQIEHQLALLEARQRQMEIEGQMRERRDEEETERRENQKLQDELNSGLKGLSEMRDALDTLDDTWAQTGHPWSDLGRDATWVRAKLTDIFGGDSREYHRTVDAVDTFNKYAYGFANDLAQRLYEGGKITNQQLEAIQRSSMSSEITPDANRKILADKVEKLLQYADRNGYSVDNRSQYEDLIGQLRQSARPDGRPSSGRRGGARRAPENSMLQVGDVDQDENGNLYRYNGGDPTKKGNWKPL